MATTKSKRVAQNPLILRCHRLMEAFAKSDDERDFHISNEEGYLLFIDLDKPTEDLLSFEKELAKHPSQYSPIPKLTFYEMKKIMEGFVNEKVYDIDTKEKLLDIIQSKEARQNFLDFVYDHDAEFEKWQQYYQERSRIRIIEWLRNHNFHFVFEEDLDLMKNVIDKLKQNLFESKVPKEIAAARKALEIKAKTYYSNEALNPRPKRGRPPKQAAKMEVEPQISTDIYLYVPKAVKPFLFSPDITSALEVTFSSKFENAEDLLGAHKRTNQQHQDTILNLESLNAKLESLRSLSTHPEVVNQAQFLAPPPAPIPPSPPAIKQKPKKAAPKKVVKKAEPKKPATKKRSLTKLRKVTPAKPAKKSPAKKATATKKAVRKVTPTKPKKSLLRRKPVSKAKRTKSKRSSK